MSQRMLKLTPKNVLLVEPFLEPILDWTEWMVLEVKQGYLQTDMGWIWSDSWAQSLKGMDVWLPLKQLNLQWSPSHHLAPLAGNSTKKKLNCPDFAVAASAWTASRPISMRTLWDAGWQRRAVSKTRKHPKQEVLMEEATQAIVVPSVVTSPIHFGSLPVDKMKSGLNGTLNVREDVARKGAFRACGLRQELFDVFACPKSLGQVLAAWPFGFQSLNHEKKLIKLDKTIKNKIKQNKT